MKNSIVELMLIFLLLSICIICLIFLIEKMKKRGILSDKEIRKLIKKNEMINPLSPTTKGISSGISSYGYDAKLGNKLYLFHKKLKENIIIDPKNFDKSSYEEIKSDDFFIIPPYGFALGKTEEYFKIPEDILVICLGKSTYARCGLIVNVTPLEPGWEGYVTLEFSNTTPYPLKLYVNEGICQFIFLRGEESCEISYKNKNGKYMNQKDIVLAKNN